MYKAVVGPSREVGFGEVIMKNERGWCWRDRSSEATQAALTLSKLESGLGRGKKNRDRAQNVARYRLGENLFLECRKILWTTIKLLQDKEITRLEKRRKYVKWKSAECNKHVICK